MGVSPLVWLTLVLQAVSGLFYPCIQVGIQTLVMRNTEGAFIGRVSGAITPVFMGMMVIGMLIAPAVKELLSLAAVFTASGGLLVVGALLLIPLMSRSTEHRAQRGAA